MKMTISSNKVIVVVALVTIVTLTIILLTFKNKYDTYLEVYQQVVNGGGRVVELPEGGTLHYILTNQGNEECFDVTVTCLERQQTLDYVLENFPKNMSKEELAAVQAAGGFLQIITLVQIKNGELSGKPVSVITGWEKHITYTVPIKVKELSIQKFPQYCEAGK